MAKQGNQTHRAAPGGRPVAVGEWQGGVAAANSQVLLYLCANSKHWHRAEPQLPAG